MTKLKLLQLERLLSEYHDFSDGIIALEKIRPCLFMIREQLSLIDEGYIDLATLADQEQESKYFQ